MTREELKKEYENGRRDFLNVNFDTVDLNNLILRNACFHGACFFANNLRFVNFSRSDLHNASFCRSNISDANFRGAELRGTDFLGAIYNDVEIKAMHVFSDAYASEAWAVLAKNGEHWIKMGYSFGSRASWNKIFWKPSDLYPKGSLDYIMRRATYKLCCTWLDAKAKELEKCLGKNMKK